jgi:hypothetical protein
MKYTRLYAGPDELSHFEEVDALLTDRKGDGESISDWLTAKGVAFRVNRHDYVIDWHTAPRRQLVANLQGVLEIEASDGEVRQFGPGSIFLVEDTHGKGHRTRVVSEENRVSIFVALDGEIGAP